MQDDVESAHTHLGKIALVVPKEKVLPHYSCRRMRIFRAQDAAVTAAVGARAVYIGRVTPEWPIGAGSAAVLAEVPAASLLDQGLIRYSVARNSAGAAIAIASGAVEAASVDSMSAALQAAPAWGPGYMGRRFPPRLDGSGILQMRANDSPDFIKAAFQSAADPMLWCVFLDAKGGAMDAELELAATGTVVAAFLGDTPYNGAIAPPEGHVWKEAVACGSGSLVVAFDETTGAFVPGTAYDAARMTIRDISGDMGGSLVRFRFAEAPDPSLPPSLCIESQLPPTRAPLVHGSLRWGVACDAATEKWALHWPRASARIDASGSSYRVTLPCMAHDSIPAALLSVVETVLGTGSEGPIQLSTSPVQLSDALAEALSQALGATDDATWSQWLRRYAEDVGPFSATSPALGALGTATLVPCGALLVFDLNIRISSAASADVMDVTNVSLALRLTC